jgi:hypothetical protein
VINAIVVDVRVEMLRHIRTPRGRCLI